MENTTAVESRMVELVTRTLADLEEQGVVDLGGEPVEPGSELFGETGLLDSVGLATEQSGKILRVVEAKKARPHK